VAFYRHACVADLRRYEAPTTESGGAAPLALDSAIDALNVACVPDVICKPGKITSNSAAMQTVEFLIVAFFVNCLSGPARSDNDCQS
jgi:hypothetical protein